MIAKKKIFIVVSMTMMAVMFYLWGHSDGTEGRVIGPIGASYAADNPPEPSPTKTREMDVYYPGTEELKPDEMRVKVTLGVQQPDRVDCDKVASKLPIGKITVEAVKGGLDVPDDESDDIAVIATAAVDVYLDLP